jgi:hypothetical protein
MTKKRISLWGKKALPKEETPKKEIPIFVAPKPVIFSTAPLSVEETKHFEAGSWEATEPPKRKRQKKTAPEELKRKCNLSVSICNQDRALIRDAATLRGLSVSAWARPLLIKAANRQVLLHEASKVEQQEHEQESESQEPGTTRPRAKRT